MTSPARGPLEEEEPPPAQSLHPEDTETTGQQVQGVDPSCDPDSRAGRPDTGHLDHWNCGNINIKIFEIFEIFSLTVDRPVAE